MFAELDLVTLTVALPNHGLAAGKAGTVVHVYRNRRGYMVEFTAGDGATVVLAKVSGQQIRAIGRNKTRHSRPRESVAEFFSPLRNSGIRFVQHRDSPDKPRD